MSKFLLYVRAREIVAAFRKAELNERFRQLRFNYGNYCGKCGSQEKLEFAHIFKTKLQGQGRGKNKRYWDIVKHPLCYMLNCRECHQERDSQMKLDQEKGTPQTPHQRENSEPVMP